MSALVSGESRRVVWWLLSNQPVRVGNLHAVVVSARSQPGTFGGLSMRCVHVIVIPLLLRRAFSAVTR